MIEARIEGNFSRDITGIAPFDEAGPNDLTFAVEPGFLARIAQSCAGAVIVPDSFEISADTPDRPVLLKTENPKIAFFKMVSMFFPDKEYTPCIHASAVIGSCFIHGENTLIEAGVYIGDNVKIGSNVHIMPGTYIGDDVVMGDDVLIKPNVTIMEKTTMGSRIIIHSGTVVGSDGYGFAQNSGRHEKLVHKGFVAMGDDVEIGACNTIDRGTLGKTIIGNSVKTDNLVHIAHNVKIGDNTLIVAQVGIAGSTTIGRNVIIAGQAGITGHITIGDGTIVGPCAGVHSNVGENQIVSGSPHMPHTRWRKMAAVLPGLPEMRKKLIRLEKQLKDMESVIKSRNQE